MSACAKMNLLLLYREKPNNQKATPDEMKHTAEVGFIALSCGSGRFKNSMSNPQPRITPAASRITMEIRYFDH